ncbi:resolvase [Skermania sp. ID1734]|uniref:recombinase family protein n=1 Tax=Skermania sp. ID1734 TaxID=2597516 RepID=UPI0011802E7B|nr:recombinase family protein [Skermania sp. ID1734]TSE01966.1 resolvase [Skermania sp. ID1734]
MSRRPKSKKSDTAAPAGTVVAYVRCSTAEQVVSGLGLEAQRATIQAYAERKGLTIVEEFADPGISGKSLENRPGALAAIEAVRSGKARGLIVARLDRLSRSVPDAGRLIEQFRSEGIELKFCDLDIDTATPAGEMAANVMVAAAQYERRIIGDRISAALQAKKARNEPLGARPKLDRAITRRIVAERESGESWQAIANRLMADRILTPRGKAMWYPASVAAIYNSDNAADLRTSV